MTLVQLHRSAIDYAATGRMIVHYSTLNNISIPELADRMRCSQQTVRNWMSGKTLPSLKRINRLSELFGIYPDDMLCLLDPEWEEEQ